MSAHRLALAVVICVVTAAPGVSQQARDMLSLPGLIAPVEILRDAWGMAHVYAHNEHDLFFAQGFNPARDRIFQLEMWRRRD